MTQSPKKTRSTGYQETICSVFGHLQDTKPVDITLQKVYDLIVDNQTYKHQFTLFYRKEMASGNKKAADSFKSNCSCFTPCVLCQGGRSEEHIVKYTGVGLADFDHVPEKEIPKKMELLRNDPHTLLAYVTISGKGIRVIFGYKMLDGMNMEYLLSDPEKYKAIFFFGNEYFKKLLNLDYDKACQNPNRLSVIAYDPSAHFNPKAKPIEVDMNAAMAMMPHKKSSSKTGGTKGRPCDDDLTRLFKEAEKRARANNYAFVEGKRNEYVSFVIYQLNRFGVSQEEVTTFALQKYADYNSQELLRVIKSIYRSKKAEFGTEKWEKKGKKAKEAAVTTINEYLLKQGEFRHNVITGAYEARWFKDSSMYPLIRKDLEQEFGLEDTDLEQTFLPLKDHDLNTLLKNFNIECEANERRVNVMKQAIESRDVSPAYNPLLGYLKSLPVWDKKTDYIGELLDTVHIEGNQERFKLIGRRWIVGVVKSWISQQTNEIIFTLIGHQGVGKTSWFRNLVPPALKPYYKEQHNYEMLTKDDLLALSDNALICMEEIDAMNTRSLNTLKAMVSQKSIKERRAYSIMPELKNHIASFCATGNRQDFLTDTTGSRRWGTFLVKEITPSPYEYTVNHEGVFSQAYYLATTGYQNWLDQNDQLLQEEENAMFMVRSSEEEICATYLRKPRPGEEALLITSANLVSKLNIMTGLKLQSRLVGNYLSKQGYKKGTPLHGLQRYEVVLKSVYEMEKEMKITAAEEP